MNRPGADVSNVADRSGYAAIYCRVSTEDQGKGYSIPTQLEACLKVADREGYTVPESHRLRDEGLSGTTMDRPGLRTLRELVTAQAIAAVIVIDPDRLSRNLGYQLPLAEEFEQASVKLLIVSHPMEQGPEGWLFFRMRGALAEYERAKMLERMNRGRVGRAKAGLLHLPESIFYPLGTEGFDHRFASFHLCHGLPYARLARNIERACADRIIR